MKPKLESRLRTDGKYDFHLIAENGEPLMNSSQGYDHKNLKRAASTIKKAMASAQVIIYKEMSSPVPASGGGPGPDPPETPPPMPTPPPE